MTMNESWRCSLPWCYRARAGEMYCCAHAHLEPSYPEAAVDRLLTESFAIPIPAALRVEEAMANFRKERNRL